ncbi:DeoR family transcriptional regulator [Propionibacterium acidifaciens]|uniref:DeoR family transcriptional regulator n=1 Tax=Propionibacterium acidifaciens TaxID=556499 RepID=UPI000684CCE9|nr:DeoR family transcriptional regulator [Propionibacterium acidifaciens]
MGIRARQLAIAKAVMAGDAATAEELAGLIGVSVMTIYRDVSILEDCGVLRRNRGRIVAVVNGLHAVDAIFRVEQGSEEKRIIARAGASLVAPGSSVLLDDSSAGVWLFRSLDRVDTLTIVTNSGCHETKSFLVSRSGRCSKS